MCDSCNLEVAQTIVEQLGGVKFQKMTGAKTFVGYSNRLTFRLPGARGYCADGINYVEIKLTPNDEYDMIFSRIRGTKVTQIAKYEGVYFDQLQELFTKATGLRTSL
jgi:hypothetical protein